MFPASRSRPQKVDAPRVRATAEQGNCNFYLLVIRQGPARPWAASRHWASGHTMLTGHATAVASWVTRELALDEFFSEVLPD